MLTAEEISSLYAGGAGKPVSAFLPPPPLSSNADLAGLVPSAGNLSPAFASGTTAYTVSVPNAVGSITLTSTAAQANATISILGIPVASGEGLEFGIAPGSNPTDVVVTAQDGTVKSYTVTVIRAPQANVAPVAIPQTVQVESGTSAAITLAGSDADGNALTYTVITLPTLGTLSGTAPALTYRPTTPGTAEDSFTFKVNDGTEDSPAATVTIHITTGPSLLADVTRPGDVILSLNGTDKSPPTEQVANAIDDSPATKYLNFGEGSAGVSPFRGITGFTVTPGLGASVVSGLGLTSANDSPDRDPASYKLEGSNNGATFALIAQGEVPPFSGRFTRQELPFANALSYNIYRLTFPTVFNAAAANAMQIAEVELIGYPISDVSNLRIEIVNGQILIQFRGTLKAARDVTGPFLPVAGPEASPVTIRPDATTQFYIAE